MQHAGISCACSASGSILKASPVDREYHELSAPSKVALANNTCMSRSPAKRRYGFGTRKVDPWVGSWLIFFASQDSGALVDAPALRMSRVMAQKVAYSGHFVFLAVSC